ncbi:MAG: methyltransferase domain-containing protein [Thermoplasmata archaeon]
MNIFDRNFKEYEIWFEKNWIIFENEVNLLKSFIKNKKIGIEIGVGTGRFAQILGTKFGIDISLNMLRIAKMRGIEVLLAFGEKIPFKDETFDYATLIVTICFLNDPKKVLNEINRIIKKDGKLYLAFIESESKYGKYYEKLKENNVFYKEAKFYSSKQIKELLQDSKFEVVRWAQTLFNEPGVQIKEKWESGNDKGSFIVVEAKKLTQRAGSLLNLARG